MQKHIGDRSLEMKIPNISCVCVCVCVRVRARAHFNLKTKLLSGQVIDGMVAKETETGGQRFHQGSRDIEEVIRVVGDYKFKMIFSLWI